MFYLFRVLSLFYLSVLTCFSFAVEVRFPEEELESEYAIPSFSNTDAVVLGRRVIQKHKISVSTAGIYRGDEPFYFPLAVSTAVGFFLDETHGAELNAWLFIPGLSTIGTSLTNVSSVDGSSNGNTSFNAKHGPHPFIGLFASYRYTPLYGKISLSKEIVHNFHTGGLAGLGVIAMRREGGKSFFWAPALQLQIDQKVYFTRRIYAYGMLNVIGFYGPNVVSRVLKNLTAPPKVIELCRQEVSSTNCLRSAIFLRTHIGLGVGMLLL